MQVGSIETVGGEKKRRIGRSRISGGGSGRRNGGGGGSDGPGGNGGDDRFGLGDGNPDVNNDKPKIVAWFVLLVVLMTFGGLIGAYIVVATNKNAEWRPFDLPVQLWISTVLIITSSFTYHIAKKAFDVSNQPTARRWLTVTTVVGAAFISSQLLAWLALYDRGLYMSGNPYAGFFYILTAAHALHVVGGIVALGAILTRSWLPTRDPDENDYCRRLARSVGWYWHFMGALWIALFLLLGFWK